MNLSDQVVLAEKAKKDAEFEKYFSERRPEFAHLWEGKGFMGGIGIYNKVRKELRAEFEKGQ